MVLSNKKLKQKLRANLAESLTESESQNNPTTTTTIKDSTDHPNSQTQLSLKSLLDSAIQKPRLSKREKKRREKIVSPQEEEEDSSVLNKTNGGAAESHNEGGPEGVKKKKRKRDGENSDSENLEDKKLKNNKNKKKKKRKKKSQKEREVGDVEVKKSSEMGVSGEQSVAGTIKTSESQVKVDLSTKVYVGGVPYYSTEDDIGSFFEGCGSITEIDCMKFPDSGKFRGIAIISFKTEAAAKRALELDGADMGGLFLKIQLYKATREHKPSDFSPAIIDGYNRIYVGNLSWDITEDDLRKLFSDCNISSIRFGEDKETRAFRGYAHVDFANSLSVTMALKLDQKIVCGRPVRIRCAVPKKAAAPNSNFASTGEKDDNRGLSSNPKFTPTIEKDDYVGLSSISKSVEMSEKYDNGGLSSGSKYVEISEKDDNGGVSVVSGKIRRRTCYECGEKGHLSSACPKINSISKSVEMSEKDDNGGLSFAPKSTEMSEKADNGGVSAVSGKIRRRTCYECGEKGHLSSACPKLSSISKSVEMSEKDDNVGLSFASKPVEMSEKDDNVGLSSASISVEMSEKADNGGVSVVSGKMRRRTCYECGEKGHLSSACPKKQASEAIISGAS